jgi:hypothetical protein
MTDNMQIVLNAFETLFNKRDYAAAERFWSPNYVQHSAHIPPGREGLFASTAKPRGWSTTLNDTVPVIGAGRRSQKAQQISWSTDV